MAKITIPLSQLSKREFDEAYGEVYGVRKHLGKSVLSKDIIIYIALQLGQITQEKAIEFQTTIQDGDNNTTTKV